MNFRIRVQWYLAMAGLAVALAAGGYALAAPDGGYLAPPLGSTWTTSVRDTGSFGSGTAQVTTAREERQWEGKQIGAYVSPRGATLFNPSDGSWVALLGPDGKPAVSWDPPIGYAFPLAVGKTWSRPYQVTLYAKNQTVPVDVTWKVEAYEDVTVPAGTFKAFKIVSSDTLGNANIQWFYPELGIFVKASTTRTDKNPSGPGTRESELVSHTIRK